MGKYSNSSARSFNTLKHSKRAERSKRKTQSKYLILLICVVVVLIVLALATFLIMAIAHSAPPSSQKSNGKTQEISYAEAAIPSEDLYKGDLLLVNTQHKYRFLEETTLVTAAEKITTSGCVKSGSIQGNAEAFAAFDAMMKKYVEIFDESDVWLTEAYRTEAEQAGHTLAPGYSDHHTGRLLTIKKKSGDELSSDNWIYENCYKYGFVVRYPAGKSAQTGVSDYTYAFRYVGVAHATYMQEHNLCMEEYVVLLQNAYASGDLLRIDGADGNSYAVYYLQNVQENTTVSLPENFSYTASGDNTGGYIITVNLGKTSSEE